MAGANLIPQRIAGNRVINGIDYVRRNLDLDLVLMAVRIGCGGEVATTCRDAGWLTTT
jgi:hypothetical protein